MTNDSRELDKSLDKIQGSLLRLKALAVGEVGDLPEMDVLRALWSRLARPDHYGRFKSNETLLTDIMDFYKTSSYVIRETVATLNQMEAELEEFHDDLADPHAKLRGTGPGDHDRAVEEVRAPFGGG